MISQVLDMCFSIAYYTLCLLGLIFMSECQAPLLIELALVLSAIFS